MLNSFQPNLSGDPLLSPAIDVIPITPADSDLLDSASGDTYVARALLCTTSGVATIVSVRGVERTGVPITAGTVLPVGARRVIAFTGTGLFGLV
jgi:hypothetical protein